MPLNDGKIRSIIVEQSDVIEERYDGHRDTMIGLIHEILDNEQRHRVSPTNIQQKINDKFGEAARLLKKELWPTTPNNEKTDS